MFKHWENMQTQMFEHWEYIQTWINQFCLRISFNMKLILPKTFLKSQELPLSQLLIHMINKQCFIPFIKEWYAKRKLISSSKICRESERPTFLDRTFVIEGLEGAWKETGAALKHRRQKLPIAPRSSSRFPRFPWKLKTKFGTPQLQNSFNNVLSSLLPSPPL